MLALLPAAAALLLGSTLTFWLQPMIGRLLLPEYGGSASVWAVCLAAFQALLLAGYGYAYLLSRLPARLQRLLHLLLLAAASVWVWRGVVPLGATGETWIAPSVLRDVLRLAGVPFVIVAAGSTLLQNWMAQDVHDRRVYRLYALSNVGSCIGLLLYPLVLEPFAAVQTQRIAWAVSMAVYTLAVAAVAAQKRGSGFRVQGSGESPAAGGRQLEQGGERLMLNANADDAERSTLNAERSTLNAQRPTLNAEVAQEQTSALNVQRSAFSVQRSALNVLPPAPTNLGEERPSASRIHFWFPCLSSALLVAITTQVTQQIIALPLVWALLLGAFLLSYVVGFNDRTEQRLEFWRTGLLILLILSPLASLQYSSLQYAGPVVALLGLLYGTALMAVSGIWLHGVLYASRPPSRRLPRFYFLLAAGGALGGSLTSLVAPACLTFIWEFPAVLIALAALALTLRPPLAPGGASFAEAPRQASAPGNRPETRAPDRHPGRQVNVILAGLACVGVLITAGRCTIPAQGTLFRDRDFYGTISVWEKQLEVSSGRSAPLREFNHNRTSHGKQYFLPGWRGRPLSYFGPNSGVAMAIDAHPRRQAIEPMRVGIVGLGIGSIAAYARTGDDYVCYEISSVVLNVATNAKWFTFLSDCPATLTIKPGDGRKLLEAERAAGEPRFDVLFLDAFAGDSPPLHLVTREAFALYLDRLAPDGIIAMNVSNWHMDLLPLCKGVKQAFDLHAEAFLFAENRGLLQSMSSWVLFSREAYTYVPAGKAARGDWSRVRDLPLPTDQRGSALRFIGPSYRAFQSPREI